MTRKLVRSIRALNKQKSDKLNLVSGALGVTINGREVVDVPNRDGYVFVRLRSNLSELIQAYNGAVSPIYDLPVLVTYENNRYAVYGRDTEKYGDWGDSAYLPLHGDQHSFAPEIGLGGDVAWIYSRQFVPLSSIPSGTDGAGNVIVNSHIFLDPTDSLWKFIGDEGTPNVLGAKPSGSSARLMLLCWDVVSQDPIFITGSLFPNTITGTAAIVPYIPPLSNNRLIPISAIRLASGTDVIGWDNIYDLRQFAVASTPPFVGGIMVQDEGVGIGTGAVLNFVGDNVQASLSGDTVRIYMTGTPVQIQDEGVSQGTVTTINFVGANVGASVAGSIARVFVTGSIGATSQNIQDEGAPQGSANTFNFVGPNVDASVSGTVVRVFITGSVGGGGGGSGSIIFQDEAVLKGSATILNVVGSAVDVSISGSVARLSVAINTGTLDARYLKLDGTNDPMTGDLSINANLDANYITSDGVGGNAATFNGRVEIIKQGTAPQNTAIVTYQELTNQDVQAGVLNIGRYAASPSDNPVYNAAVIDAYSYDESGTTNEGVLKYDLNGTIRTDINPSKTGTGTAVLFDTEAVIAHHGKLIMLESAGTPKFWVNGSGTAFEAGTPLAKTSGVFATFTTVDGKTVTVRDGVIVSVV